MYLLHPAVDKCTRRSVLDGRWCLLLSLSASHLNIRRAMRQADRHLCSATTCVPRRAGWFPRDGTVLLGGTGSRGQSARCQADRLAGPVRTRT